MVYKTFVYTVNNRSKGINIDTTINLTHCLKAAIQHLENPKVISVKICLNNNKIALFKK